MALGVGGGKQLCLGHEGPVPSKWHQVAILGLKKAKRFCFLVMHRRTPWEPMHCGRFIFSAQVPLNACAIQEQIVTHIGTDLHLQLLLRFLHFLTWEDFSAHHSIFTLAFCLLCPRCVRKKGRKICPVCVLWQPVGHQQSQRPSSQGRTEKGI